MTTLPLCKLEDIPDGHSKGMTLQEKSIIAVRQGNNIYLYENRCPHLGVPLEWQANQFLSPDRSMIQCNTHGALFSIDTGECISGPCLGEQLPAIQCHVSDGNVYIIQT